MGFWGFGVLGLVQNTFFLRVPSLDKENLNEFKGHPSEKSVLLKPPKHTLIFCRVVIGTHTNWKIQ